MPSSPLTLALDGQGGDRAPSAVVEGAALASTSCPNVRFLIFGREEALSPHLQRFPILKGKVDLVHTDQAISSHEKPSRALRHGKESSMYKAVDAVRSGDAAAVISSGSTGAFMAIAAFRLRTMANVDRPALVSFFPSLNSPVCMLDLGANVQSDAENLVQFAIMGDVCARIVMDLEEPTLGLLNIGVEELKGRDEFRVAASVLRELYPHRFKGFVEGHDIPAGKVHVVTCDGFSGNIALKTMEGTAKMLMTSLRQELSSSLLSRLGYLLARPAFQRLRTMFDPRRYNGALFAGLSGLAIKSHGGSDAYAFSHAVSLAARLAERHFLDRMQTEINLVGSHPLFRDESPA